MIKHSRKSWNNPYPKSVKTHRVTARIVFFLIAAWLIIGLSYTFVRFIILDIRIDKFAYFPDLESLYKPTLKIAQKKNPTAKLAMVWVYVFDDVDDERLNYTTRFYFCSPEDDSWTLSFEVERKLRLFRKNFEIKNMRALSTYQKGHLSPNCQSQIIDADQIDVDLIVETLRSKVSENSLEILEEMPRILWVGKDEKTHLLWEGTFRFYDEDYGIHISYDASDNEIKEIREGIYPYRMQIGLP
jgi:hypothetical protein